MKFEHFRMKKRLSHVFAILVSLMILSGVFSFLGFQLIGVNFSSFYHVQHETTKNQLEIRKDIQTINKRILWAIVCNDPDVTQEQIDDLTSRYSKINSYIDTIKKNLDHPSAVKNLETALADFETASDTIMRYITTNNLEEAVNYYGASFNDISEVLADALNEVGDLSDHDAATRYHDSNVIRIAVSFLSVILLLCTVFLSLKLQRKLERSITYPLDQIQKATADIAAGNLSASIDYNGDDEIGEVADSLRVSMSVINHYIEVIDDVMKEMADGNLDITIDEDFIGDFQNIKNSIVYLSANLSESMHSIHDAASQVSQGSSQISNAAQTLAESATEQAGIVQELSTQVGEVTERIKENAKSATAISQDVMEVSQSITASNQKMQDVVLAMNTISETSQQIQGIIDTINTIASQTNLLSLNASIEAARAGEAGRGFAVVADQVSQLAHQSSEAANTSAKLIEAALRAVEDGTKVADTAASELNAVARNTTLINNRVESIAKASADQEEWVTQINTAIDKLAEYVESNAATAEENSAASEQLNSEALTAHELLQQFTLKESSL